MSAVRGLTMKDLKAMPHGWLETLARDLGIRFPELYSIPELRKAIRARASLNAENPDRASEASP
jgi:hypothetical protein